MTAKSSLILFASIIVAVLNAVLILMLATPRGHFNLSNVMNEPGFPVIRNQAGSSAVQTLGQQSDSSSQSLTQAEYYTLQWRHVKTEIVDQYRVETYEEFQIYKNSRGQIVKTAALPHYEYLRYYIGKNSIIVH